MNESNKRHARKVWIKIATLLGVVVVISTLIELLMQEILLSFEIPILRRNVTISNALYYITITLVGSYIGSVGLKKLLFGKKFSVEFLMAVAAFGAMYLNFLFEGVTVLFLYSLSEHFENYIEERAKKTIESLSKLMPDTARLVENGLEREISVKEAKIGMTLLIKPGERIPLDGRIINGSSSVDQSVVSGESTPVLKNVGDYVFAGTLNLNGSLKVEVVKDSEETLVSKIAKVVIESRKRKASIERLVDKFAHIYVPIVVLLAILTGGFGPLIMGGTYEIWLYRSLILLVISCPSAFIISIPATMFTAITLAAKNGIIIKGGAYIEKIGKAEAILFDKTGTLTLGKPIVNEVSFKDELDPNVLKYAAALEKHSNHPSAQAIVQRATDQKLPLDELVVEDVTEVPGKGIVGLVDKVQVAVGNLELMQQYGCNCDKIVDLYVSDRHTPICVSINKVAEASICLIDTIRKDATKTINRLKSLGIHTMILSGDKKEIAEQVSHELGVDNVYSELLPEDKLEVLSKIKDKYSFVVMVGDGINDAPALAVSDVGIAMGGSGVDVALESADIVLVKDELAQIPYLVKLSRKTMSITKQNIAVSLGIKLTLGALGLFGLTPLWFAFVVGDDGLTLLTLLNTLRLSRVDV
ncbi:MAG: cation-translocating P-type ATPase [Nitrososphaeria archaeon]